MWKALGFVYIWFLTLRSNVRAAFERGTTVILTLYVILVVIEVILEVWGRTLGTHETWWIRGLFYFLIFLALYTKVREWGAHHQELYFIGAASSVVQLDLSGATTPRSRQETIEELLNVFRGNFELKGALNANFAELIDGHLKVTAVAPPNAEYDKSLALVEGDGGSGYCYEKGVVVYIPRKRLRHGIVMDVSRARPFQLVQDLYVSCNVEPFNSILSVPVTSGGHRLGVLNFDSKKGNAFRRIDFQQAAFFGFVLAKFLHEARSGEQNQ